MSRAEDIYTELSDSPISRASGLRDYAIQLEETVEQLQADNARLQEALELEEKAYQYPTDSADALSGWGRSQVRRKAIASTDSSNWLAEQKAQWREEVLEEVAAENFGSADSRVPITCGSAHVAVMNHDSRENVANRRMAEQPESK